MHKLITYTRIMLLLVSTLLTACSASVTPASSRVVNTTPTITVQTFEGSYGFGTEISSFVPCGMNEMPGPGKGYWLVPNDEFSQLYQRALADRMSAIAGTYGPYDDIPDMPIYVRFEGVLSPPASAESGEGYGHLSLYAREVKVTKALKAQYYLLSDSPCNH